MSAKRRSVSPGPDSKRPRLDSAVTATRAPASGPRPPPSQSNVSYQVCWFHNAGGNGCLRPPSAGQCPRLHLPYRRCIEQATRRHAVPLSQLQGVSNAFHPYLFRIARPASSSSPSSRSAAAEAEDEWVAAVPVPVTDWSVSAFCSPKFVPALSECTGLRPENITVISATPARMQWGSIVLRGPERRVLGGREAVIFLISEGFHRSHKADSLLPLMQQHVRVWRDEHERQQQPDPHPDSERRRAEPAEPSPSPSAAQAARPTPRPALSSVLTLDEFDTALYPERFVKHLDTTPVSYGRLAVGSSAFCPRLCLAPPLSSSPLSCHVLDPLFIVSFPFPVAYVLLFGSQTERRGLLAQLAGLEWTNIRLGAQEALPGADGPVRPWAALKAIATQQQLDLLMEAFFRFILRLKGAGSNATQPHWAGDEQRLVQDMEDWKQRRIAHFRPEEMLFSLQSRGLRCPPLRAPVPPPLPSPESCRPCQGSFSVRGCVFEAHCPNSHLPFAQHFGLLSSSVPVLPKDIPSSSERFAPVLALLPPSLSSSTSARGRYVLCVPFPRLNWLVSLVTSCAPFQSQFGSVLLTTPSMARVRQYESGLDSTGWLNLVAEVDGLEAVDELLESALFIMEEAHLMRHSQVRSAELSRRQAEFRERRSGWTGDRQRPLLSLDMRGVKLRCPPLMPPSPAAPPLTAPLAVTAVHTAYTDGGSQGSIPRSPPPPYSFHAAASPLPSPPKPAEASLESEQSEWTPLLREMKQRGQTVSYQSDVLIPDFSSSDAAFICCRADSVFACIPIPATEAMRNSVYHQQMPGLQDVTAIEQKHGVEVYVPRLLDDAGRTRNEQQLPWLNVCVKQEESGLSVDTLDPAVKALIARCRRAMMPAGAD